MPDATGLDYAEERSAIRRALRVRRITPSQPAAAPKRGRFAWVGALVAVGAVGLAITLVSQTPRRSNAPNPAAADVQAPAVAARLAAAPPPVTAEPAPVILPPSEPIALGDTETAPEYLRVALEASTAEPARVDTAQGLRIVNAIAGNRFGLRAGDVVVDLCDRAGVETAVDISAAIATDATTCLTLAREGTTSDVSIAPAAVPPLALRPEQADPADGPPAPIER